MTQYPLHEDVAGRWHLRQESEGPSAGRHALDAKLRQEGETDTVLKLQLVLTHEFHPEDYEEPPGRKCMPVEVED